MKSAILRLTALASCAAALAGCQTMEGINQQIENPARVDPVTVAVYARSPHGNRNQRPGQAATAATATTGRCQILTSGPYDIYDGAIDLDCFQFPGESDLPWTAYQRAVHQPGPRNRLVSLLLNQSDQVCTRELGRMSAVEATTNSSLGIASTIMNTAATIFTGETANAILSGGATVFNASRDHINAHVYRAQLTQAVTSIITQERNSMREAIERRFNDTVESWSVDQGIREVNAYHQTCSFFRGLELVMRAANQRTDLENRARLAAIDTLLEPLETRRAASALPEMEESLRLRLVAERARLTTGVVVGAPASQ